MTQIDYDRMEELRNKELLSLEEAKELGHMYLAQLINVEVACWGSQLKQSMTCLEYWQV